jgi:uncharacterized protein (TIGR01777 family)
MRFLLTGATGFIGRHLGEALRASGHELVVLARDADRAARLQPGARVHVWNGNVGLPPAEAFEGVDVVANLIGEDVAGRWTEKRRRAMRDSRVLPTRALVERMETLASRPRVFLSMSGSAVYGDRGDEILTETSRLGTTDGFLVKLAGEWEAAAQAAPALGVRTALFRTGAVLGKDGGMLKKIRLPFRMGVGGRLGSGKQYFPWIHVDDVVGVFLHTAAHEQLSGPMNLVAPEPATNAEFTAALAQAYGRSAPFAVPGFALKLALGDVADEMLLASQRMSPARVLQSGYVFRFPLLQDALRDAVQTKGVDPGAPADGPAAPPASTPPTGTYPPAA